MNNFEDVRDLICIHHNGHVIQKLSMNKFRRNSIHDESSCEGTPKELNGGTPRERKVMFKKEDGEIDEDGKMPLHERSSPVEEWSSDSRDSPQLEMSRYDNVSPNGTLNRSELASSLFR